MRLFRRTTSETEQPNVPVDLPPGAYRLTSGNVATLDGGGLRVARPNGEPLGFFPYDDIEHVSHDPQGVLAIHLSTGVASEFVADPDTAAALEVDLNQRRALVRDLILQEARDAGGVVVQDDGDIVINVSSVAEAKLAVKKLRLKKRELQMQRKAIVESQKVFRTDRRSEVAQQGSKMIGGGKFGRAVRAGQTVGRDADRRRHVGTMAQFDQQKASVDAVMLRVDAAILQLEQYILTNQ